MFEFATSGLLGGLLGGVFRLLPEVIKYFDKKNERQHELSMFQLQTDLEKIKGDFKVEEKYVDFSVAQMQAIQAANESDAKIASASWKWVAAAASLVRPTITYTMFGMYVAVKAVFITAGLTMGNEWAPVLAKNWTQDDFTILMMILTFWFVGRSVEKYERRV